MKITRKCILLLSAISVVLVVVIIFLFHLNKSNYKWNVEDYENLDDIISVEEIADDSYEDVVTYKIMYNSDDCKVASYLSIPQECMESQEEYPCIIYNRGGNRDRLGVLQPEKIAAWSSTFKTITFASQYRGVDGGR